MTQQIIELYENGVSLFKISKIIHRTPSTIAKILRNSNITIQPKGWCKRKYNLSENYFEIIDTHAKAQILGMIYADGYLCRDECSTKIQLQERDKEYLLDIASELTSTKPLYYRKPKTMKCPRTNTVYNQQGSYTLVLSSKQMFNDLLKIGLCHDKSNVNLGMPSIPENFIQSFLLGYFEGDGCITFTNGKHLWCEFNIIANQKMVYDIKEAIKKFTGIEANVEKRKTSSKEMYYVRIRRKEHLRILYNWIYSNSPFKMIRKYKKWTEMISLF